MSEQHSGFEAIDVPITLGTGSLTTIELRPQIDFARIIGNVKPTKVTRGIVQGHSLPTYAADEELYFDIHVPDRYDEASDITAHVHGYLDTANDGKKFRMTLEWEHVTFPTDAVPNTDNDVTVETSTGTAAQYQSFSVPFTIDYDIDGADIITGGDCLYFRLRRIAATELEIAGEFVICHIGIVFRRDKIGAAA